MEGLAHAMHVWDLGIAFWYFGIPTPHHVVAHSLFSPTNHGTYGGSWGRCLLLFDGQTRGPGSHRGKPPRPLLDAKFYSKTCKIAQFGSFCGISGCSEARQAGPRPHTPAPCPPRAGTQGEAPAAARYHCPTHLFGARSIPHTVLTLALPVWASQLYLSLSVAEASLLK